jgi:hypothetical protein
VTDIQTADARLVEEELDVFVKKEDTVLKAVVDAARVQGECALREVLRHGVLNQGSRLVWVDWVGHYYRHVERKQVDKMSGVSQGCCDHLAIDILEVGVGKRQSADGKRK